MDREPEELQHLGFYGIYKEAYNITASSRKIFSQITLAFILPLSFICLAQTKISDLLFPIVMQNAAFYRFKVLYHIFLLVLSLLSTSAVVYTSACAYTFTEITFNKVVSVVPTVWKRLMITFLWATVIMFLYNLFAILVIWHLASVVSVLEESYGYKAFLKSKALIKGKMLIAFVVFIKLEISFMVVLFAFENLVAHGRIGVMGKIILGIFCLMLLSILIYFALVIQTVVYLVSKSYHHENMDKSCLNEHLEAYNLGDHVPLTEDKDIQSEEYEVLIESPP
ncbi:hypothetical protein MKW98_032304 [Papaver atlanticum]|uniref:Uncharacterized protein n=1 Tax=Papaver atlanticum TaxID=357466 RepID=A0AAD4SG67_9MAGN|nr:hypothetical protein MKW98_032304 [Papaver atlanticum]